MHNLLRQKVLSLQTRLNELGYGPLAVDGVYGKATQAAYHRYLDDLDPSTPTVTPAASKPWWLSRAVIGILVSVLATLAARFGWQFEHEALTQVLVEVAQLGGLVVAFWGTVRRSAPIDPTLVARVRGADLRLPVRTHRTADDDPRGAFRDS